LAKLSNLYSNFPSAPAPAPKAAKPSPVTDDQDGGQNDIEQDPAAMKCIDLLVQKGYTADEVAQAMDDLSGGDQDQGDDDGSMDDGSQSPGGQSAPLQIPGMR
jgi:hypothetical protein